jgi:hypothetical protein
MSSSDDLSNSDRRDDLEREAEVVRARLSQRLALLDGRKDRLVDSVKAISRPPLSLLLLGAGAAIFATVLIVRKMRHRPSELERLIAEFLQESKLLPPPPDSPLRTALKRGLTSAVTLGLREVGRRGVARLLAPSDVVVTTDSRAEWAQGS